MHHAAVEAGCLKRLVVLELLLPRSSPGEIEACAQVNRGRRKVARSGSLRQSRNRGGAFMERASIGNVLQSHPVLVSAIKEVLVGVQRNPDRKGTNRTA